MAVTGRATVTYEAPRIVDFEPCSSTTPRRMGCSRVRWAAPR